MRLGLLWRQTSITFSTVMHTISRNGSGYEPENSKIKVLKAGIRKPRGPLGVFKAHGG